MLAKHMPMARAVGIHLYCHASEQGVEIQSRMFAPLFGVPEDPATGSANVVLIGLLAHFRPEAELSLSKTIGQGFDMGRPSVLEASAEKKAGRVVATYIGGRCVPMLKGTIDLT
jgi:trans-2,3-dihydro-3-hydroxyanthranilate isomerase